MPLVGDAHLHHVECNVCMNVTYYIGTTIKHLHHELYILEYLHTKAEAEVTVSFVFRVWFFAKSEEPAQVSIAYFTISAISAQSVRSALATRKALATGRGRVSTAVRSGDFSDASA